MKQLQEQLALKEFDPETKVKKVIDLYNQLNIKTVTENLAYDYINSALILLDKIGVVRERKKELIKVTSSLIGRDK